MNNKIILQALMGLDIGGAETHVIELSMELKRRGYEVIVASNGGIYEPLLREYGIETINIPLHSKKPSAIFQSIKGLYKTIKEREIGLIHSHARIPSSILYLLQKILDFNMITTAHGEFRVNPILKRISKWGDKVFVVSDDIKTYLIENYNIDEKQIYKTVNGIDTAKFKSGNEYINNDYIVHISRLDKSTSMIAKYLIKYARDNPHYQVLIVGGGSSLDELEKMAKGLKNISFVGESADIARYLNKARLFIGISRSALEAMCYNIPIILAGDSGYMGIVNKEELKEAEYNNFTARNTRSASYELIKKDIDFLLNGGKKDRSWERQYIKENYSVGKMVDYYEEVYKSYL